MPDPFELWLLAWQSAVSHGMEQFIEAIPGAAALPDWRGRAEVFDLSALPVLGRVRTDLPTMLLLEQREPTQSQETPVLIVAPYAVHDASIGDFADSHSVAQILSKEHPVAMTFWKSANAQMRYYGIDAYLSDLNVAIDDLGGCASLVGLCQGGWLAAVYASRFPKKARKLVLVGRADRSCRDRVADYPRLVSLHTRGDRAIYRDQRRDSFRSYVARHVGGRIGGRIQCGDRPSG